MLLSAFYHTILNLQIVQPLIYLILCFTGLLLKLTYQFVFFALSIQ